MKLLLPGRRPLFPPVDKIRPMESGLVAHGGDLAPDTVLEAYEKGIFPWSGRKPYDWYSPDPRLVLVPGEFHASETLRKLRRQDKVEIRYDTAFRDVMTGCGEPRAGQWGTWITQRMLSVYCRLHWLGVAHSIEAWEGDDLVGGLYGLSVGRMFFGESMFARRRDASKLAFWDLCRRLDAAGYALVDCQADSSHLRTLGAKPIPRAEYLERLAVAWAAPEGWPDAMAVTS
jgi:leucyl/phenylalanyl-tRNA--protein transferase